MSDHDNIRLTGDHRDIPLALGMITILWNACEGSIKQMLRDLASGGDFRRCRLVESLVVELNSVGLEQALNVYADEFPDSNLDISDAIRHASTAVSLLRPYRNYYVHGISAITRYGIRRFQYEDFDNDTPFHEAMFVGPAGKIYVKSAKNKTKFSFESVTAEDLTYIWEKLLNLQTFLEGLELSVRFYLSRKDYRKHAPLPALIELPRPFTRPVLDHPKLRLPPSLDLENLYADLGGNDHDVVDEIEG